MRVRLFFIFVLVLTLVSAVSAQDEMMGTTFTVTIENVSGQPLYPNHGVAAIPTGESGDGMGGVALPGGSYEFTFTAHPGDTLAFVTMFAQSNDLFLAPDGAGIALFDDMGAPINGDVTDQIKLWDAGTEQNQPLGEGDEQAPRQAAPNTGADEMGVVHRTDAMHGDMGYPTASEVVNVTVSGDDMGNFTVTIHNVSDMAAVQTPITPVVWVVQSPMMGGHMGDDMMMGDEDMSDDEMMDDEDMSDDEMMGDEDMSDDEMMDDEDMSDDEMMDDEDMSDDEMMDDEDMSDDEMMDDMMAAHNVFFTEGEAVAGHGLESLAEDGDPAALAEWLGQGGFATPITPVVWAVHDGMMDGGIFFDEGQPDRGEGLEALAEDGNFEALAGMGEMYAASGVAAIPDMAEEAGPLLPGHSYAFTFEAAPGQALSFATMFVESNDVFFAPDVQGIALFDDMEAPIEGDVTSHVFLWDLGTEVNEEPGAGANQPLRQAGPNTGDDEMGTVQHVHSVMDGFNWPFTPQIIRVTISTGDGM